MIDYTGLIIGIIVYLAAGFGVAIVHIKDVGSRPKRGAPGPGQPARWTWEDDMCFCPVNFLLAWLLWPLWFAWHIALLVLRSGRGARTVCGIPLGWVGGRRRRMGTRSRSIGTGMDVEEGGGGAVVVVQEEEPQPPRAGEGMRTDAPAGASAKEAAPPAYGV